MFGAILAVLPRRIHGVTLGPPSDGAGQSRRGGLRVEAVMLVEPTYRGFRIEVVAVNIDRFWDAEITIRTALSQRTVCAGRLCCRKPTASSAEESGTASARQWIDKHGQWFTLNSSREAGHVETKPAS